MEKHVPETDDRLAAIAAPGIVTGLEGRGPQGLAAFAGALAEWDEIGEITSETHRARRRSRDRRVPRLD